MVEFRRLLLEGETVVASRTRVARSWAERLLGLIVLPPLAAGEGLWLNPCGSIHTFGLSYAIDAVFLDASLRVLRIGRGIEPGRIAAAPRGTRSVLELRSGAARDLSPGDQLRAVAADRQPRRRRQ